MFSPLNYGYSPQKAREMAENILNELGISHLKDKIIHYLSGGEKRKVALAGALVMSPELLVLDEPFSGLDMKSQHTYVRLIDDYSRQKGISVILSTHDIELTVDFADTIYLISSQNKLFLKGSPKELFCQPKELEKFNLEPPAILDLFVRLKEKNVNTEIPTTVDEAVDLLLAKLNVQ